MDSGVMSDLCMYEFEDIVWDEFGESDDHMVPHPSKRPGGESNIQSDSCKKSKHEVVTVSGNIGNMCAAYGVVPGNEKTSFVAPKRKDTTLEKVLWPHSPHGVFPASCDGDLIQEVTGLASDDSKMPSCFESTNVGSGGSQLCGSDLACSARCIGSDNNVYQYPLTQISQTDNDIILFNNDLEHKEGTDLLYDGWTDLGNFEDVDMFRSCDSTFGLGGVCNEDEMGWFTPSNALGGSDNIVNSGMRVSCSEPTALGSVTDYPEAHKVNNESSLIDNCNKKSVSLDFKTSSCISDANQPAALNDLSSMSGSSVISDINDDFMLKKKANFPHMPYNCGYLSDKMPFSTTLYGDSCEKNAHPSFCPRESSSASNQVQSEESSHYNQLQAPPVTGGLRREKTFRRQELQATLSNNPYYGDSVVGAAPFDPIKFQEKMHVCENEVGDHSDAVGVNVGALTKIDYSNVPESSCLSSLDEISVEATSFRQLQQVTEQLDIRTKLCIRDSLYRLATSAEQRHCANKNGCSRDGSKTGALAEKTDECAGFMDMETDTNPIDRSIAHLLFYSTSDPPRPSANDTLCHKSNAMVHGSITSPPLLAKKLVREETAAAGELMSLITEDQK